MSEDSNDFNDLEVAAVLANVSDGLANSSVIVKDGTLTLSSCTSNSLQDLSPFKAASLIGAPSTDTTNQQQPSLSTELPTPATINICQLAAKGELVKLRQLINDDNINSCDAAGCTPLLWAVDSGWSHIVGFLLARGADLGSTDERGATALIHAASLGHRAIVDVLLAQGADINATCHKGNTALHFAVFGNHIDCLRLLLESGADLTIANSDGLTPDLLAARLSNIAAQDVIYAYVLGALSKR